MSRALSILVLAFAISGMVWSSAFAQCSYFRSSLKVSRCVDAVKTVAASSSSLSSLDLPPEEIDGPAKEIRCACGYTLQGSDPRCDFDRLEEPTAVVSVQEAGQRCEHAPQVCGALCEKRVSW